MDAPDVDAVFKALADRTRRLLLDRLREQDGQTLGELCARLGMARQSATQHLDVLVGAGLVTVVRRGRERLHFLNPAAISGIGERWISPFDRPRLQALAAIRDAAEERAMSEKTVSEKTVSGKTVSGSTESGSTESENADAETVPTYVYVTYVRADAQQVWQALTDADLTARYWGHSNVSDWQPGSRWEHRRTDGSGEVDAGGRVLEADPPHRLVMTFGDPGGEEPPGGASVVTFLVEQHGGIVRLTVTHENLADGQALREISLGWPAVLANLKSLLETGEVLPEEPWAMPVRA
ncbi:ArsR/SmtB family transcription factor [Geodermatophilus amargosae]|uniref:ArsR/SmtB family transcription factor n=1 Tax=Geodermatophilus amargosae TaxID=1296565 RepID=UPI001FE337F5|nr:metalloregulator ArsR/SmtB family transcription factor [Geodermatophilus amargosae]